MAKDGINRTIDIPQPSLFGRIGTAFGEGLASQLPEEIGTARLAAGFKNIGQTKGLNPFQQFAQYASIPGVAKNPQLLQTGGDLLRQQSYLDAIKNQFGEGGPGVGKNNYVPTAEDLKIPLKGEIPTLATPEATAQSYKEYIPPSKEEEIRDAQENFLRNPLRYNNNFQEALKEREAITARNQERQQAYQSTETRATGKEGIVKDALDKEATRLGILTSGEKQNFDPKLYQQFEQKALNSVLSKKDGGEGLTQEQAIKKYSNELDQAYRNYGALNSLSSWSPIDFNRRINSIVKNMEPFGLNGKKVIFDKLIANQKVSPSYAGHKVWPIGKGEIPTLNKLKRIEGAQGISGHILPEVTDATYEKLKKEMGKNNSPLSIAYELERGGQDPRGFLNYLNNHRDNLEVWQAEQLNTNINLLNLKDMWLQAFEE